MKRFNVNKKRSTKRFNRGAKRTHRLNKKGSSAFIKRGGIRL